ncbi:hypothetical protein [Protofrankia symbiont of Coriaria ruscifolia]|nr:hypothetical protein [Protofrankia symbiont of Coriaria ruscifolia]
MGASEYIAGLRLRAARATAADRARWDVRRRVDERLITRMAG